MAVHFPEDLVSLFSVTARDVIWFKDKLVRFLRSQQVPIAVIIEIEKRKAEPTVRLCQYRG
jgi:hypothetical protein